MVSGAPGRLGPRVCECHQAFVLHRECLFRFNALGIHGNAVDRADLTTLRHLEMPHAFGALVGIDHIVFNALADRAVRTFGLADVTVDAVIGDQQSHGLGPKTALAAPVVSEPTPGYPPCLTLSAMRAATTGWTNLATSPPRVAISRTIVADTNMYLSAGVRNMVSTSGIKVRFIPAI